MGNTQAHVAAALFYVQNYPDELREILVRLLDDPDPSVSQGAAIGLARCQLGDRTKIINILTEGLKAGQFQIRCAQALGAVGPDAAAAIPVLEQSKGYVLGIAARDALAKINAKP